MPESLSKKQKLLRLRPLIDLETGEIHEDRFTETWKLYRDTKAIKNPLIVRATAGMLVLNCADKQLPKNKVAKYKLDYKIANCRRCPEMNIPCVTEAAPGWGSLDARIFFIGQSLHSPGLETGIPFILGSGLLIDAALQLSDIKRHSVFFTNAVHCHPLRNRQSTDKEKRNCLTYLKQELKIVAPDFIVAFGNDARGALESIMSNPPSSNSSPIPKTLCLTHPASLMHSENPEGKVAWVLRLSNAIDKYSNERK